MHLLVKSPEVVLMVGHFPPTVPRVTYTLLKQTQCRHLHTQNDHWSDTVQPFPEVSSAHTHNRRAIMAQWFHCSWWEVRVLFALPRRSNTLLVGLGDSPRVTGALSGGIGPGGLENVDSRVFHSDPLQKSTRPSHTRQNNGLRYS